jgi:hypothetical protein
LGKAPQEPVARETSDESFEIICHEAVSVVADKKRGTGNSFLAHRHDAPDEMVGSRWRTG